MDTSSFINPVDFFTLTDITPVETNGATSVTYKARINNKWHFLKRLKPDFVKHPFYRTAFEKEFEIGYTLDHPNIVRYIAKGTDAEGFYFFTEYVDGQTLGEFIATHPAYFKKKENLRKFIRQLLSALAYLHNRQILHLDLKPDNILITTVGRDVKLVDLGFAYSDCYQYLTIGRTNSYAAPEQIYTHQLDQRTDIYGVGMLLLYIFTQTADVEQLPSVPRRYRWIVRKCLNSGKDERFTDVYSLENALLKALSIHQILYPSLLLLSIPVAIMVFVALNRPNPTPEPAKNEKPVIRVDTVLQPATAPVAKVLPVQAEKPLPPPAGTKTTDNESKAELSATELLHNEISRSVKGYFSELYASYSFLTARNFDGAQRLYNQAVNASTELADSLCRAKYGEFSCDDIKWWVRVEVDKNSSVYLHWLIEFEKKNEN